MVQYSRSSRRLKQKGFYLKIKYSAKGVRETECWLYNITESELVVPDKFNVLRNSLTESISMLVSAIKTTKKKYSNEI